MACEVVDFTAWQHSGRAICFTLLKALVGIPGNSAPGTTSFSFEVTPVTKRKTTNAREKKARAVMPRRPCWRPSCHAAHAGEAALPFSCRFPGPVHLLCGRLPHTSIAGWFSGAGGCLPIRCGVGRFAIKPIHSFRLGAAVGFLFIQNAQM